MGVGVDEARGHNCSFSVDGLISLYFRKVRGYLFNLAITDNHFTVILLEEGVIPFETYYLSDVREF